MFATKKRITHWMFSLDWICRYYECQYEPQHHLDTELCAIVFETPPMIEPLASQRQDTQNGQTTQWWTTQQG